MAVIKGVRLLSMMGLALFFVLSGVDSHADHRCGWKDAYGKASYHGGDMEEKFFRKAHFILAQKDELGLSADQEARVRTLMTGAKKDLLRQDAEIGVLAVDIDAALAADEIDVDGVTKLLNQKYELKKTKVQSLVASYAELKKTLDPEQKTKLKTLFH